MLDFVEEALDEIALAIKPEIKSRVTLRLAFGGITGMMARLSRRGSTDSVVSLVADKGARISRLSSGSAPVR